MLVLANDLLTRSGLVAVLQRDNDLEVVLQDEELDGGHPAARRPKVDAAVWDVGAGRIQSGEIRSLAASGVGVLALVEGEMERASARSAGALGVLPRSVDEGTLIAAIHAVCAGLLVSHPEHGHRLPFEDGAPANVEPLTPRELEVLQLVAQGLANKAIAARLGIRESTVKDHVNSFLGKLGAQSRTEAVTVALRHGLISI
ncbi:MAG TPA: response regulator transcription factor [Anaerolineales bacterium]|nr:response regulator transcription factor [Anaerolineales bacterium]